ncbi:hypothetical protein ACQKWADRAFT_224435 [Trichoderma austrokoningii]
MMNIEHLTLANIFWTWLTCCFKGKGAGVNSVCFFGGLGRSVGYVLRWGCGIVSRAGRQKSEIHHGCSGSKRRVLCGTSIAEEGKKFVGSLSRFKGGAKHGSWQGKYGCVDSIIGRTWHFFCWNPFVPVLVHSEGECKGIILAFDFDSQLSSSHRSCSLVLSLYFLFFYFFQSAVVCVSLSCRSFFFPFFPFFFSLYRTFPLLTLYFFIHSFFFFLFFDPSSSFRRPGCLEAKGVPR